MSLGGPEHHDRVRGLEASRARRSGTVALSPTVAFVLTCLTVVTIVLGHLAAYEWTENVFLAVLVLPMLFFAVIGDNRMLFAGWVVVTIGLAIGLGVEHLRPDVFWAALELYAALNLIAALMIVRGVRKLHFRFRSRDALRELTKTFAGATRSRPRSPTACRSSAPSSPARARRSTTAPGARSG